MAKTKKLPTRAQVKTEDTWDLASLFKSDEEWEKAFVAWEKLIPKYEKFRGTLGNGPEALAKCFKWGYDPNSTRVESDGMGNSKAQALGDWHQACARLVTADYCGDGVSHTRTGTAIDQIPRPKPHQPWHQNPRADRGQ